MILPTQIHRGIAIDLTSLTSRKKARVESEIAPLTHTHGNIAESRNTMYGDSPTVRSNT
jgi:hypothetical protein